jgi:mRNA interferase RelE/StbE
MQVDFTKHFSRQLDSISDKVLLDKLQMVVFNIMNSATIRDIHGLKKLKGHHSAYRIRLGDYRIGIFIENGKVLFAAFEHRKDIYSRFP